MRRRLIWGGGGARRGEQWETQRQRQRERDRQGKRGKDISSDRDTERGERGEEKD